MRCGRSMKRFAIGLIIVLLVAAAGVIAATASLLDPQILPQQSVSSLTPEQPRKLTNSKASESVSALSSSQFPMEKGTTWVYEGTVKWTLENSNQVETKQIRWTTEITESFKYPEIRVAVLRGFPSDLAWYEEGKAPGTSLLIESDNCFYYLQAKSEQEALRLARGLSSITDDLPQGAELLLDLPLRVGKRYDQFGERDDNMYCWYVESKSLTIPHIEGINMQEAITSYRLIYRSNPDHEIMDFVPGLGIVRYIYEHHGTVAFADVRLKEFHHPVG